MEEPAREETLSVMPLQKTAQDNVQEKVPSLKAQVAEVQYSVLALSAHAFHS